MRVAVVEDEAPVLAEITAMLTDCGLTVVAACQTGEELMKILAVLRPEAVFIDIVLPGMDGLSLGTKIRASEQGTRLIFMSGDVRNADLACNLGAEDFLLKPFDRSRLAVAVARLNEVK